MYMGGISGVIGAFLYERTLAPTDVPNVFLSIFLPLICALVGSALMSLLYCFLTITLRANQNVTGLAITTFGVGLYFFVGNGLSEGGAWPAIDSAPQMKEALAKAPIPLLSRIPLIGEGIFSQNLLVYLGVLIAVVIWFYLKYTRPGLKLRAIGENPAAADSVGIKITLYKYLHIMLGSGIMGIGGLYMGLNLNGSFEGATCWINGYGWISVALVIFANWNPVKAILGTLVFGFFNTLYVSKSVLVNVFPNGLGWLSHLPDELFYALPYIITAIVLIVDSVKKNSNSGEPASVGVNYYREDR
jgi:simple sugar transport system permease protein